MNERSNLISKLRENFKTRAAYIEAKVGTLVPSQIRALRLKSDMPRQADLAQAAEMHQSRISMFETPGANPTLSTLSSIAAALNVGLKVEFVPFSEMLDWENHFSQDQFKVVSLPDDVDFLRPAQTSPAMFTVVPETLPEAVTLDFRSVLLGLDEHRVGITVGVSLAGSEEVTYQDVPIVLVADAERFYEELPVNG